MSENELHLRARAAQALGDLYQMHLSDFGGGKVR